MKESCPRRGGQPETASLDKQDTPLDTVVKNPFWGLKSLHVV
ncbi:hypothetical protein SALB1_1974 [Salinisphaera sp. LB1]|nr:hypothetical protein SALB1_1974 [Salinisphaera sp. LB1]